MRPLVVYRCIVPLASSLDIGRGTMIQLDKSIIDTIASQTTVSGRRPCQIQPFCNLRLAEWHSVMLAVAVMNLTAPLHHHHFSNNPTTHPVPLASVSVKNSLHSRSSLASIR